jgi:hypothetical protein
MDTTQGNQWDNRDILRFASGIFVRWPRLGHSIILHIRVAKGIEIEVPGELPFVRGGRIFTARSAFASQA